MNLGCSKESKDGAGFGPLLCYVDFRGMNKVFPANRTKPVGVQLT